LLANLIVNGAFASGPTTSNIKPPQRLAIYYGFPSLVNGSNGSVEKTAQVFSRYDVIVLGDGLQFDDVDPARQPPGAGPDEHRKTRDLISLLRQSRHAASVYGYVTLGNSQKLAIAEIRRRASLWAEMGVRGIFLDEAGYDFGNTRSRQNGAVEAIHQLGLGVFMNAYRPEDLFSSAPTPLNAVGGGNPEGSRAVLGTRDIFLLESFQIREGQYEDAANWHQRTSRAVAYRDQFGTRVFGVTTCLEGQPFSHTQFEYAWWSALLWGLDGFGWVEAGFSSRNNSLPWRDAPSPAVGARFVSSVGFKGSGYSRRTDRGTILVDTAAHSFRFVPNPPAGPKPVR